MKSLILFVSLAATIAFTACKKTSCDCDPPDTISGKWNMDAVYGGLQGVNLDYTTGEVIWSFDVQASTVEVTNNILTTGPKSIYARFSTGNYPYAVQTINGNQILTVDTVELGVLTIAGAKMTIDDGLAVDGFVTEFIR